MLKRAFITGAAGFIGAHLSHQLIDRGWAVLGIDNLNDYYDVRLKEHRLDGLSRRDGFSFVKADLVEGRQVGDLVAKFDPDAIVHLAAQAGVRYSIDNPQSYVDSNLVGFLTILESARERVSCDGRLRHLVYASSSSVYGQNAKVPYSVADRVDSPVSLYAATKRANELMAHTYSHLYGIPATGLRFFTVYGPAGRPDMAYFKFTEKAIRGETIDVFNMGDLRRDFTYIDDIADGVIAVMGKPPQADGVAPHAVYNIGNSRPEGLVRFIDVLEEVLTRQGLISAPIQRRLVPMQAGDVYQTYADLSDTEREFGFRPTVALEEGLEKFAAWYADYTSSAAPDGWAGAGAAPRPLK